MNEFIENHEAAIVGTVGGVFFSGLSILLIHLLQRVFFTSGYPYPAFFAVLVYPLGMYALWRLTIWSLSRGLITPIKSSRKEPGPLIVIGMFVVNIAVYFFELPVLSRFFLQGEHLALMPKAISMLPGSTWLVNKLSQSVLAPLALSVHEHVGSLWAPGYTAALLPLVGVTIALSLVVPSVLAINFMVGKFYSKYFAG